MIEALLDSGLETVLFVQQVIGDWFISPARFLSFLGTEEFFLLILPIVYWSIHAGVGLRIGLILLVSNGLNAALKLAFNTPRPFWYSQQVDALAFESSFGAPSGHAQNGAGVWGIMAASIRQTWAWVILTILIILIGLSRVFLGVHFMHDVALGWLFGIFLVWLFLRFETPLLAWMSRVSIVSRLLVVFLASLVIILLGIAARVSVDPEIPPDWVENATAAFPVLDPIDPFSLDGLFTSAGALFGLGAGAVLLNAYSGFDSSGSWQVRLMRYPIGLIGILLLYFGLGAVFPRGDFSLAYSMRYLRYFLIGIWVSAGAPLVFIHLKLAFPRFRSPV
jgi:membrane-associated phospholipid phosphatase